VPQESIRAAYFLISYPHTEHNGDHGSERAPDYWVIKFYNDLCRNVEELVAAAPGIRVGVLDRDLWVEDDWIAGLPAALGSCRVLVPLYSQRYFESDACGKEWHAFADRPTGRAQPAEAPAIVPVMWMPMPSSALHPAARSVPIEYGDVDSYTSRGLYGIIKRAKYRADYFQFVREVAQRVVDTAKRSPAAWWPDVDYDSLPNPFGPAGAPESGAPRLLITVLAPQSDNLPAGRHGQYYGRAAWDWMPYRPASQQPIAQFTANFARSLGYRPYVCDLQERADDLLTDGQAAHPELLIVDPWAVTRPDVNRLVAQFKLAEKPWVQVVIPWNPADAETATAESQLRLALSSALGRKLELGRVTAGIAVGGVPSIAQFGSVLPSLIPAVGNRYLGNAAAYPPDGSVVEKPTLQGFTPSPQNSLERARA
jgi:FxsC-like protein